MCIIITMVLSMLIFYSYLSTDLETSLHFVLMYCTNSRALQSAGPQKDILTTTGWSAMTFSVDI